MGGSDLENRDSGMGVSLWITLAAGPLLLLLGYVGGWESSFAHLGLLSMSVLVAALFGEHEFRIPLTGARFAPRQMVVFWAILNLGVSGGVAVAAAAAASGFSGHRGRRLIWARSAFRVMICALLAAFAFDAGSGSFQLARAAGFAGRDLSAEGLVAGFAVMLAVHFFTWSLLDRLLAADGPAALVDNKFLTELLRTLGGQAAAAAAGLVLFAAFRHFGYEFGLVVVPLAVLGNISYQIHIRRLAQKTREIVDASRLHLATVEALATAIDARDQVGVGHVRRTQIYAVGIGSAIGLCDGDLNALRAGALLHDIGKLAVPEHILNKPGRLTSAELEKTKVHALVGASILERVGFPYPVQPTVKYHHEHWDGSGYPDGLSGDRIPVTARILAVADAYDSLRGERPYRAAVSREDACSFLRSRAGTQFDPHIVTTFLRNLKQLEAEIEIHGFGYEGQQALAGSLGHDNAGTASYVEQIKRANQEVFSLYEMARDFGASLNLEEALSLLTQKVAEFVPYDTCVVYLLNEEEGCATAAHVEGLNSEALAGKQLRVGEGATGYVLKKRKPVENVDPSLDFAFSFPELCDHYVGMASVPLLADEKLIGAITVFSGKVAAYEEEHLRLLETISRIAGDAIDKSIRHAESEVYALTDPLTGLPNARSLQLQFDKEIGRAKRAGDSLQLLMLDLDGFKAVNDNLGHKAGDTLLKEISRLIKTELRDYDFLARYGGDEFVALVPETDTADVIELCARIEAAVGAYSASGNNLTLPVGVSIGAASYPAQGETYEALMIAADKAMYRAKAFRKQRHAKLVEEMPLQAHPEAGGSLDAYSVHDTIPPEAFESDFVVELDERHIVTVNTVN